MKTENFQIFAWLGFFPMFNYFIDNYAYLVGIQEGGNKVLLKLERQKIWEYQKTETQKRRRDSVNLQLFKKQETRDLVY